MINPHCLGYNPSIMSIAWCEKSLEELVTDVFSGETTATSASNVGHNDPAERQVYAALDLQ